MITEVVLGPSGNLLVGGSFQGRARFVRPPPLPQLELIDPNGGARPTSFLAVADPVRGTWVRATLLPNLSLRSMAIDEKGDIYLTGPGTLARRYSASFQPIWDIPAPLDTVSTEHIATGFDSRQPGVYIQGEFEAGPNGNRGVFVVRLDKLDGRQRWRTVINSANGEERAGGLGVGPLGGIRAAVPPMDLASRLVERSCRTNPPRSPGTPISFFYKPQMACFAMTDSSERPPLTETSWRLAISMSILQAIPTSRSVSREASSSRTLSRTDRKTRQSW